MTAEEWKKVDEALTSVWSPYVHLKIDGYKVSESYSKIEISKCYYGLYQR